VAEYQGQWVALLTFGSSQATGLMARWSARQVQLATAAFWAKCLICGAGQCGSLAEVGLAGFEIELLATVPGLAATIWSSGFGGGDFMHPQRFLGTCYHAASCERF
jgi:hypothetical protein